MLETVGIIMGGSILAFMLEVSEYMLVLHTSGLTLSIAGIFKVSAAAGHVQYALKPLI